MHSTKNGYFSEKPRTKNSSVWQSGSQAVHRYNVNPFGSDEVEIAESKEQSPRSTPSTELKNPPPNPTSKLCTSEFVMEESKSRYKDSSQRQACLWKHNSFESLPDARSTKAKSYY